MTAPLPPDSPFDALVIDARVAIPRSELSFRASRAGGAGGQHVNTSSTRVELLWAIDRTRAFDDETRAKVRERLAARLDAEGLVRVVASKERSQLQNREAAEERLAELVRGALAEKKKRRPTKVPRRAKEQRLAEKKHRSERKRFRGRAGEE